MFVITYEKRLNQPKEFFLAKIKNKNKGKTCEHFNFEPVIEALIREMLSGSS